MTVLVTLGIGIGATTAIFSVVNDLSDAARLTPRRVEGLARSSFIQLVRLVETYAMSPGRAREELGALD
jgi:hypothetical protein